MSEVEQARGDDGRFIEEPEATQANPIEELIDAIAQQNFNQAKSHFEDVLGDKMNDALEAEKLSVAQSIYNDAEDDGDNDPDDESENDWLDDYEDSLDDEEEVEDEEESS